MNQAKNALTVTFSADVYKNNIDLSSLESIDFELNLTGGNATLASKTPTSIISKSQNIWILGLSITGITNGLECLVDIPATESSICDAFQNILNMSHSNNTVTIPTD